MNFQQLRKWIQEGAQSEMKQLQKVTKWKRRRSTTQTGADSGQTFYLQLSDSKQYKRGPSCTLQFATYVRLMKFQDKLDCSWWQKHWDTTATKLEKFCMAFMSHYITALVNQAPCHSSFHNLCPGIFLKWCFKWSESFQRTNKHTTLTTVFINLYSFLYLYFVQSRWCTPVHNTVSSVHLCSFQRETWRSCTLVQTVHFTPYRPISWWSQRA